MTWEERREQGLGEWVGVDRHLLPTYDSKKHRVTDCECNPTSREILGRTVWDHHAFDPDYPVPGAVAQLFFREAGSA